LNGLDCFSSPDGLQTDFDLEDSILNGGNWSPRGLQSESDEADSCGSNGNNWGKELRSERAGSSCMCAAFCDADLSCFAWTYVLDPTIRAQFQMGSNDCVLRSADGGFTDNCDGECLSGVSTTHVYPIVGSNADPPPGFIAKSGSGPCKCTGNGLGLNSCGNLCCADSPWTSTNPADQYYFANGGQKSLENLCWKPSGSGTKTAEPDNSCGVNGNNWGTEHSRLFSGSSCNCATLCQLEPNCKGWSYVPDGLHGYGQNDCSLRSNYGAPEYNCGGKCKSGEKHIATNIAPPVSCPTNQWARAGVCTACTWCENEVVPCTAISDAICGGEAETMSLIESEIPYANVVVTAFAIIGALSLAWLGYKQIKNFLNKYEAVEEMEV